ncbi:MAG: glycosyl transferase, partial [Caulobacteraceae bacterium]
MARLGHRSIVASLGGQMEQRLLASGAHLARMQVQSRNPLTLAINGARLARAARAWQASVLHVRSRAPAFSA